MHYCSLGALELDGCAWNTYSDTCTVEQLLQGSLFSCPWASSTQVKGPLAILEGQLCLRMSCARSACSVLKHVLSAVSKLRYGSSSPMNYGHGYPGRQFCSIGRHDLQL